jgi:predicted aldo/keto reductase-like oxidoreductase
MGYWVQGGHGMRRRQFLQTSAASSLVLPGLRGAGAIPKRPYNNDISLSTIGFGGIVVVGMEQKDADRIVADAFSRGINYFDVAPSYGRGEAEEKLGPALQQYRKDVFLSCKTGRRDAEGAQQELEQSLKRLRTDHFDLYQFHSVTTMKDVEQILGPGGAGELFLKARQEGKVRYLGFSAHGEEAALALMDKFRFDSVLFPVNYVNYSQGSFGPRILAKAKEKGVTRLALKAMAYTPWKTGESRTYPNCWYRPIDEPALARQALRFTLSEDITAAIPPGDQRLFRIALDAAFDLKPLSPAERQQLLAGAQGIVPIFRS